MKTITGLLVAIATLGIFGTAGAETNGAPLSSHWSIAPDLLYIKTGLTNRTTTLAAGTGWDKSDWLWSSLPDDMTLTFDVEIGHWQTMHPRHGQAKFTQFGVTPMLRYPLANSGSWEWFVEGGVGFHFIVPLYNTSDKRFSTSFNFQDLFGIGGRFGAKRHHEVALYISHFSNAAIHQPNPGENFLQLRYLHHFD